jgi:RNA polymerase sigma-70 factor (ECF subfamily)
LLGYLIKLVKLEWIACDLLQEIFVKVWENRDSINSELSFRSYLFRIAENATYDFFRKLARDKRMQAQLSAVASAHYYAVEELITSKENIQMVRNVLRGLPPQRRQVFQLVKLQGMSYAEVSNRLNISTSTISDHIVKATKFVRQQLQKENAVAIILVIFLILG